MSHRAVAPRLFVLVVITAALGAAGPSRDSSSPIGLGVAFAQIDAGYLADVRDLNVTERYSAAENLTDVSLALAPPDSSGGPGVTLVFSARFRGRTVDVDHLAEIVLRAHYRLHSDDRQRSAQALHDNYELSLILDPQASNGITLDFFPANLGYFGFTAAGDEIPVAFFTVTPDDLRAIGFADAVTGKAIWTSFAFTPQELEAVRAFARRVLPAARPLTTTAPQTPPGVPDAGADPQTEPYWRDRRRAIDAKLHEDQMAATAAIELVVRLEKTMRREGDVFIRPYPAAYVSALNELKRTTDAVQEDVVHLVPDFYAEGKRAGVPEGWLRSSGG
jgi:hypothetical protein